MKFGEFLFPESKTPDSDYEVVNDALREAELADELGFHSIWLGEHHFDGACSYADPMTFAGAVVARTKHAKIGFSAVQMTLHHPVRVAEQIALLDNLSGGRIILGTSRGTAFNFYEYRGYGMDPNEGPARIAEAEQIIFNAWTKQGYKHEGQFWDLEVPVMRPKPYQQPHPPLIRAVASEASLVEMARQGRPVMMVIQPNDVTKRRFNLYRDTMTQAGIDDETIQNNLESFWVWRNVVVADTDKEAEEIGVPAYLGSREHISRTRGQLNTSDEQTSLSTELANPRHTLEHGLIFGSPETVCEKIAELEKIGLGGLIIHFRLGAMSWDANEHSLRLFAEKVMPEFKAKVAR